MDSGRHNAEVALDPLFLQRRKLYERSRAVKVEIDKGKAEVTSSSSEFGEASEQISVEYSGAALTISFSAQYVLDYTLPGLCDSAGDAVRRIGVICRVSRATSGGVCPGNGR